MFARDFELRARLQSVSFSVPVCRVPHLLSFLFFRPRTQWKRKQKQTESDSVRLLQLQSSPSHSSPFAGFDHNNNNNNNNSPRSFFASQTEPNQQQTSIFSPNLAASSSPLASSQPCRSSVCNGQ